jgi:GT2 family glycosyltransferase
MFGLYKLFPKVKVLGKYYAQKLSENETGKVDILVGAFMLMKRDLYRELGGFDEDCFMYSDDIDLSYRMLLKGRSNYYYHETTVIHYKGESTIKDGVYMKRFQEAMQFFYKKHFKVSMFFWLFMKIGILFFSFVKMFQGQAKEKKSVQSYIFYSSNDELISKMELKLQKKVFFHDLKTEKMVISSKILSEAKTEILLNSNDLSFKEIINFIKSTENRGSTFKVLPKNTSFFIGSDNSNERGVIIKTE